MKTPTKRYLLVLLSVLCGFSYARATDVGVPSESEDVMLQAFYWNSYTLDKYGRTKWIDLMKDTAAISANFDLVWFPPSAWGGDNGGVGYYHRQLSNQNSDWGQKSSLQSLITALHKGGTKILGDVVINHRNNKSTWCDFFEDDFTFLYGGKFQLTQEHICAGDECFKTSGSTCYNSTEHGAADTGTNDAGCRDLDHTSAYVQSWAKAYLKWMMGHMRYDGFRYDMTLGYDGQYLSMYNETAQPYISVSEYWENISKQKQHLVAANYNTMVFDFPQKYQLANAIVGGSYGLLKKNANSLRGQGLEKYAVTFIDNHDTFERSDNQSGEFGGYNADLSSATVKNRILQANAYILMMPGIPCVFWPHWKSYTNEINALIAVRKWAGIHSESQVLNESSGQNMYEATVVGHRGTIILRLGSARSTAVPEGYYMVLDGGANAYTVFAQIGTALPEIYSPAGNESCERCGEKFLRDGRLYIERNGQTYDVTGKRVQ